MNKNAYFYPRKVNRNVNLVIFNMSKITCGGSFKPFYFSTMWVEPFLSLSGDFVIMLMVTLGELAPRTEPMGVGSGASLAPCAPRRNLN